MALEQRIETLKKRHNEYDHQVRLEEARPFPDTAKLHQLKLLKLNLKDEISRLLGNLQQAA